MASVYVHFPYCLAKCPYCDFTSYARARKDIDHRGYADAVLAELSARSAHLETRGRAFRVGSVFFGGGTPSLWAPEELGRVLEGVRRRLDLAPDCEVTVECNPTSLDGKRCRELLGVGVDRLSIGTQSLDASELAFLGRLHDPEGARAAVLGALAAGVPRVSTDLIFGLPGQSPGSAVAQACALAELGLRHLSCYQLTIEPGTRFGELARAGRLPLADDGRVAEAFLAIDLALGERGFHHYEISNYALPGEEARHNLAYWRGDEYLGLGCGAFGALRVRERPAGAVRYRNPTRPEEYVALAPGTRPERPSSLDGLSQEAEELDAGTLLKERIMLGLRLEGGFDLAAAAEELGAPGLTEERERALGSLVARGRIVRQGTRLRLPRQAWLFTDDTAARLF